MVSAGQVPKNSSSLTSWIAIPVQTHIRGVDIFMIASRPEPLH